MVAVPIPVDVMRVSLLGKVSTSEIFDTSFWIAGGAPATAEAANTTAVGIRDAWVGNAATAMRALLSTQGAYQEVRLYSYPNGGPNASAIGTAPITTAQGSGTGGGNVLLQSTMVVSLRTPLAGRRFRGRMYLPATSPTVASDHLWSSAVVSPVAPAMAAFFSAINALAILGAVSVVSQVEGEASPVTEVRVDNKPDVQRRRANKLAASILNTSPVTV